MRTEPYSWTAPGHEWVNHEILAEAALASAFRALGGDGTAAAENRHRSGDVFHRAFHRHKAFGRKNQTGGVGGGRAGGGGDFLRLRGAAPNLHRACVWRWSFGFSAQIHAESGAGRWRCRHCSRFGSTRTAACWRDSLCWLPPPSPPSGEGVLKKDCAGFHRLAPCRIEQRPGRDCGSGIFTALSAVALLANPYGFELIRWLVGSVLWLRPEISEWNPAPFGWDHAAFFLLHRAGGNFHQPLAPAVAALGNGRDRCLVGCNGVPLRAQHAAVLHRRAGICPAASGRRAGPVSNSFSEIDGVGPQCRRCKSFSPRLLAFASAAIVAPTFHAAQGTRVDDGSSAPGNIPWPRVEFIQQHELRGNLLVFFDWGEMCLWELPDSRVSIDGRLDTCYPLDVIAAHWNFYNAEPLTAPRWMLTAPISRCCRQTWPARWRWPNKKAGRRFISTISPSCW